MPFRCFTFRHKATSVRQLKDLVDVGLHIFFCEDQDGNIRAITGARTRLGETEPVDVPIADASFTIVDINDWNSNNGEFYKELIDTMIKSPEAQKCRCGEFWSADRFARWLEELCGDSLEILQTREVEGFGKTWLHRIDFERYRETH